MPTRLVDYFCVIGTEGKLERDNQGRHQALETLEELSQVAFIPTVVDQYPPNMPSSPLQSHVASFAFPDSLTPSPREKVRECEERKKRQGARSEALRILRRLASLVANAVLTPSIQTPLQLASLVVAAPVLHLRPDL